MDKKDCKEGYYWVKLHPIHEEDKPTVAYCDEDGEWFLHNVENKDRDCSDSIYEILVRIEYYERN